MSRATRLSLAFLHLSAASLAGWVGSGSALWIASAATLCSVGLLLSQRSSRAHAVAGVILMVAVVGALAAEGHLRRFTGGWPERAILWEADAQLALEEAFDDLLRAGEETTRQVAVAWAQGPSSANSNLPLADLELSEPLHALAVFGASGELVAWVGSHHGPIPQPVREGLSRYLYSEGPLFGYLYVTEPLMDGGVVMAASLLRSELPPGLEAPVTDFESAFLAQTGATISIASAAQAVEGSVWDLEWEGETLFSVSLAPASEANARERIERTWSGAVTTLLLMGWLLAVVAGSGEVLPLIPGAVSLPIILLLLPLSWLTGWTNIFSPAGLLLPGPLNVTLGDLMALGLAGILVLGLLPWGRLPSLPPLGIGVGGGIAAWGVLGLLEAGSSRNLLVGEEGIWIVFQVSAIAAVVIPLGVAAALGRRRRSSSSSVLTVPLMVSLAMALALSLGWVTLVAEVVERPGWLPLLWVLPVVGLLYSLPSSLQWPLGLVRGVGVVFLGVTLVLPWAWDLRLTARMAEAEARIERLGTRSDPFLEFLLSRAAERAASLSEDGREPVEILYGAWTGSGLAAEGLPLWITYWSSEGVPREELRIGVVEDRPAVPDGMVDAALTSGEVRVRRFDLADTHYVGTAPLASGSALSVVVPPRRMLRGSSPLGPLFSPSQGAPDPMVLIPLLPGEVPGETDGVRWVSTPDGWQGETFIAYPDEVYHAHYRLELPGWTLLLARGSLLLLLSLAALGFLWAVGRWMGEPRIFQSGIPRGALGSFRGRVTVSLFAFFMIPSIVFGTLSYRTLAGAAIRTAESLAERTVEEAGARYFELDAQMDVLAAGVGSDLLLYEDGELIDGSPTELIDLGLYEGWVPPSIQAIMNTGEALVTTQPASFGGFDYVIAYRRMPAGRVLAAPTPLQAGATALRQRDVADLIAFSLMVGGILSVLLALGVGRALARPIQTLRVASERVGGGNMAVQLPEQRTDEFGAVFDAFNRMVDRLAKTKRALLRSSRRTRAIVEEVAVGVVALDPQGRVTLANARVQELLGSPVERDQPLPPGEGPGDPRTALVEWAQGYLRDELREGATDLSFGDRRIRVRARRVSRRGSQGGLVMTLEDVTDELRTERILAWGEMAQQVAHEVKNPLTPIKLGVQHIRRAWIDRKPDYEEILEKNVDSILGEIERLASIATSFSRYAAPSPAGTEPLEGVRVGEVVQDVLDLYAAGGGPVRFTFEEVGEVSEAQSRVAELKEVLINLLENARTALPSGGNVRVEVERVEDEIELRVIDDGVGIPRNVLPRVFEPHFSTRSSGTGLGLAIVRRLVESWGGRVQADSVVGEGTTIRVRMAAWHAVSGVSLTPFQGTGRGDADH